MGLMVVVVGLMVVRLMVVAGGTGADGDEVWQRVSWHIGLNVKPVCVNLNRCVMTTRHVSCSALIRLSCSSTHAAKPVVATSILPM